MRQREGGRPGRRRDQKKGEIGPEGESEPKRGEFEEKDQPPCVVVVVTADQPLEREWAPEGPSARKPGGPRGGRWRGRGGETPL